MIKSNKPFWKYCGKCGDIIEDDDVDKFLKKVEKHKCKPLIKLKEIIANMSLGQLIEAKELLRKEIKWAEEEKELLGIHD